MERTEPETEPRTSARTERASTRALNRGEARSARAEAVPDPRSAAAANPAGGVAVAALPPIPAKRYFTIGEVSELCGVKPYVLRYWEQEFHQLRPMKRRGNRRYYQHHEVLLIRRIRELLYEQGFTISGARNQLQEAGHGVAASLRAGPSVDAEGHGPALDELTRWALAHPAAAVELRESLLALRELLS